MLKLCLFLILVVALILPEDADAWRRWRKPRIRVRVPLPRIRVRMSRITQAIKKISGFHMIAKLLKPKIQQPPNEGDVNNDGIVDDAELAAMFGPDASAQDIKVFKDYADKSPKNGILTMIELNAALKELGLA